MKVLVFGDIHGLISPPDVPTIELVARIIAETDADVILQVGDMGGYRDFAKPVHWIFGNNDSPSLMREMARGLQPVENLVHIPTGAIRTFSVRGERLSVSGLNGAYDPVDFDRADGEEGDPGFFTRAAVEKCLELRGIDIFLVHGCPSGLGLGREPDHGNPAIRRILETVRPGYMFCGHAHFFREAAYCGCKVYALDQASKEYYMLDTLTGHLTAIQVEPSKLPGDLPRVARR